MMDSQETNLELENTVVENTEEKAATTAAEETPAETVATDTPAMEETVPAAETERKQYASKEEILARVKEIAHGDEAPDKNEVDSLKTLFYKMHTAEREAQQKEFLDGGGDPNTYVVLPDMVEEEFKAEMGIIRERRAKLFKEQEEEKEANLQKKLDIIEKIKAIVTSPEEANKSYKEFKALQQEWKEIKSVPAAKANELWRNYQLYVEQFYDLLKLNNEAREYDLKKNLEQKTALCEAAEKLADEEDVVSAFHQLQQLHEKYRETGPVAKELREEIWARFKAASTVVNKRHQQHFEELKAKEEDNLVRKTELCEKAEAVIAEENKGTGDWDKHTKAIIALQAEWKTIGFAPQRMNVKIFERFRKACDSFFNCKSEYYKQLRDQFKANAEKKRELIARANELKDSTDWKSTSSKLVALQKEWKTIGAAPKKISDQLWEEFLGACNHFFEARNAATSGQHSEEKDNLTKKREIVAKLQALTSESTDNLQQAVRDLMDEFNAIGHVPYKEKDKIYDEYHAALDRLHKDLNVSIANKRMANFKSKLRNAAAQGESAIDSERARLMRQYEAIKSELQTYENNIGFLTASSKKGSSLIDQMMRKVEKLKDDMALTREKIKAIDQQNEADEKEVKAE